jgi:hypothetical protein
VAVVLVVGIGGCGLALRAGFKAITAPVDASNEWLDALEDPSEIGRANAITCPSFRSNLGSVQRELENRGWDGGQSLNESSIVNASATVEGTLDLRRGSARVVVFLDRTSGSVGHRGWCVEGVTIS